MIVVLTYYYRDINCYYIPFKLDICFCQNISPVICVVIINTYLHLVMVVNVSLLTNTINVNVNYDFKK